MLRKKPAKRKNTKKSKKITKINTDFDQSEELAIDTASGMTPVHGIVDEQYDTYQQERAEQDAKKKDWLLPG
ncbi:hypothetical protein [Pedobacter sp. P26]|uniref:hypothetical protein n=1 Tax=Pedobacter sp. P26 TaxID=3423956 RepID=UPI003D674700